MSSDPWWTLLSTQEIFELRTRLVHDLTDAFGSALENEREDLAQHALMVLIRDKERVLPDDDGLFRFARRILRNAALDRVRSSTYRSNTSAEAGAVESPADAEPPAMVEGQEKIRQLREKFCELDDLDRLVLWSYVVDGRSINAIAKQLDINWHQVANMIEQGLNQFRQHLSR